jgi:hypothetical protein
MFGFQKLKSFELRFWVVLFLAAGLISGFYILIFGAPDPVLSSEGKRTVQWYLHYSEQRYGRFLLASALMGFGVICAGITKLFPYGSTG